MQKCSVPPLNTWVFSADFSHCSHQKAVEGNSCFCSCPHWTDHFFPSRFYPLPANINSKHQPYPTHASICKQKSGKPRFWNHCYFFFLAHINIIHLCQKIVSSANHHCNKISVVVYFRSAILVA